MSGRVEMVDELDDGVAPKTNSSEDEKFQPDVATAELIGHQISHEMLEELAPNGEGEHILNIIKAMTEEEALAIVEESVKFHADDWFVADPLPLRFLLLFAVFSCASLPFTVPLAMVESSMHSQQADVSRQEFPLRHASTYDSTIAGTETVW